MHPCHYKTPNKIMLLSKSCDLYSNKAVLLEKYNTNSLTTKLKTPLEEYLFLILEWKSKFKSKQPAGNLRVKNIKE